MKKLIALSFLASLVLAAFPVRAQGPSLGVVSTASPAYVNAQTRPLSLDLFGNLRVLTTPAGGGGSEMVQGNVASGVVDAGNPVKTGGKFNSSLPVFVDGQRGDTQITTNGETLDSPGLVPATAPADGVNNANNSGQFRQTGGQSATPLAAQVWNWYFNGATWDRVRGNTAGAFVQGNVAGGVADAGNPAKIGGVFMTTQPTYTDGQRGDVQIGSRGSLRVQVCAADNVTCLVNNTLAVDALATSTRTLPVQSFGYLFNSSTFDREFTCANNAVVNVTAGNTTEIVALTASQVIRVCSMVLSISLAGTATVTSGTGVNCAGGPTPLTGAMALITGGNISISAANGSLLRTASANALCVTAATGNVTGFVSYAKY